MSKDEPVRLNNPNASISRYTIDTGVLKISGSKVSGRASGMAKLFLDHVHDLAALQRLADYLQSRIITVKTTGATAPVEER